MRILTTTQEQLLGVVQAVAGIVERRHTLPILANILMRKTGQSIEFISSDLEIQIKTNASFDGDEGDFSTTLNARKLLDILRTLPANQQLSLTVQQDRVLLQSGKSKFTLQTLPASDFPLVQASSNFGDIISIKQKTLKKLLTQVSFAMAVNDIRYYLNGILFVIDPKGLHLVATDAHRLAYAGENIATEVTKQAIILPRKTVLELQRLLRDDEQEEVQIQLADNQAKFNFAGLEFVTKLVEGKFPEYERVIPQNTIYKVEVDRLALALSLQRVELFTSEKFRGIHLEFSNNSLKLTSTNAEQEEAVEELDIDYNGQTIKLGFNVSYLKDVLSNVNSEKVFIELTDGNSSALIKIESEPNFRYVVMPMRI